MKAYGWSTAGPRSAPGWCWRDTTWPTPIPAEAIIDEAIVKDLRQMFQVLYQPASRTGPATTLSDERLMRFEGKTALVTGGSRGIGRAAWRNWRPRAPRWRCSITATRRRPRA